LEDHHNKGGVLGRVGRDLIERRNRRERMGLVQEALFTCGKTELEEPAIDETKGVLSGGSTKKRTSCELYTKIKSTL